jgi:lactate permease
VIAKLDVIIAIVPLVFLIYLMTKRNSVASNVALPATAILVYILQLIYFDNDPNLINATVLRGALEALTPISIIWGAVLLFKTLELSGAQRTISNWLNGISSNPVAQLMIIGWAFAFMIEGASGFGTPAAIAAPLLVGLGFKPIPVAILTLVMNSVPVSFGAVGTPTWFGMSQLSLSTDQILNISLKTALIHSVAGLVVPILALSFVVSWKEIRKNIVFIYLSILSCVLPYVFLAAFNDEFPALVGGAIGFCLTIVMAKKNIGLFSDRDHQHSSSDLTTVDYGKLARALFPLIGIIVILVITRIPELKIRNFLGLDMPAFKLALGSLGKISVSIALVLELENIFNTPSTWLYKTLFVPAFIPFFLVSGLSILFFKLEKPIAKQIWSESLERMKKPVITLIGALIMVQLMMVGGDRAKTVIIGSAFAEISGEFWQYVASFLGALGTFFSGSATVSNLTFSGIQYSIAKGVGLEQSLILSLQSVGAAMGNMVCINNIVAVCSILGVYNQEGFILKRTVIPMVVYGVIAACVGIFL